LLVGVYFVSFAFLLLDGSVWDQKGVAAKFRSKVAVVVVVYVRSCLSVIIVSVTRMIVMGGLYISILMLRRSVLHLWQKL
jgi:hypothetical protein